jgi:hypothetical protein
MPEELQVHADLMCPSGEGKRSHDRVVLFAIIADFLKKSLRMLSIGTDLVKTKFWGNGQNGLINLYILAINRLAYQIDVKVMVAYSGKLPFTLATYCFLTVLVFSWPIMSSAASLVLAMNMRPDVNRSNRLHAEEVKVSTGHS